MIYAAAVAAICFLLRALSWDGAIAAAVVGGVIWEAGEWPWAAPLLAFFVTSSVLSRLRRRPEDRPDLEAVPRRAIQVLANGGPAAACAGLYLYSQDEALKGALIASLAAANADTWATEIGSRLGLKPVRILSLSPAVPGESGVVTIAGLFAAFIGSAVVAATAPLLGLTKWIGAISVIGFFGCLLDSILGDSVQARYRRTDGSIAESPPGVKVFGWRLMTNDTVNFVSTALAAGAGYWLVR